MINLETFTDSPVQAKSLRTPLIPDGLASPHGTEHHGPPTNTIHTHHTISTTQQNIQNKY